MEVPKDGDCLLHSIALAYLISSQTEEKLQQKLCKFVGTYSEVCSEHIYKCLRVKNNSISSLISTKIWRAVINSFRNELKNLMANHEIDFICSDKNPEGFLPQNSDFYNASTIQKYLEEIAKPGVWLGTLEIQAASRLLSIQITVNDSVTNSRLFVFDDGSGRPMEEIVLLFDKGTPKHYNPELKLSSQPHKRKLSENDNEEVSLNASKLYDTILNSNKRKRIEEEEEENIVTGQIDEEFDNDVITDMEIDRPEEVVEEYLASGLKRSLHGTIYQVQLLMLFALRGKKFLDYKLASEMDDAEKFDDVVFQYKENDSSPWKIRFLQAKHKQDKEKFKITVNDLSSIKDDDFSLHKYFVSFCKIKNSQNFEGLFLEEFVICTNTSLDLEPTTGKKTNQKKLEQKEFWRALFEENKSFEEDNILFFIGEKHKEYIFKSDPSSLDNIKFQLKEILEKRIIQLKNVKEEYTTKLSRSKFISASLKTNIEQYITTNNIVLSKGVLISEVLDMEENISKLEEKLKANPGRVAQADFLKISENYFLLEKMVSENNMFRSIKKKSAPVKINFLDGIKDKFQEAIRLRNSIDDWFQFENSEDNEKTKLSDLIFSLENIEKYIDEFVEKFRLIVEYPDETLLNTFIADEIGEDYNLINARIVCDSFEKHMWNWLKAKKGRQFTKHSSETMFESIKLRVNTLLVSGISQNYPEYLKTLKIKFKGPLKHVNDYLNKREQIFFLETDFLQIGSLEIYHTIESKIQNVSIFLKLETLLIPGIRKKALDSFAHGESHDLCIIECQELNTKEEIREIRKLYLELKRALERNHRKKIIFIAKKDHCLIKHFSKAINSRASLSPYIFSDVESYFQDQILNKEFYFQGKIIKLGEIVNKETADNILDGDIIISIINNANINIQSENNAINCFHEKDYYVSRRLYYQEIKRSIFRKKNLLFVSDISQNDLGKIVQNSRQIFTISTGVDEIQIPLGCNLLLFNMTTQYSEQISLYEEVCQKYPNQPCLWLKHIEGSFYVIKTNEYFDDNENIIEKSNNKNRNYLEESEIENIKDKIILVAESPGMGKSTFLDSVSYRLKENNPTAWITKICLLDFGNKNYECNLGNINFTENDYSSAISFCISMILFGNNSSISKKLSKKILSLALDPNEAYNIKIIIMFDGFDEISPNYKENVLTLIKALQMSKVYQIWITTRIHMKKELEKSFNCYAYSLNEWEDDKTKTNFLCKYWNYILKHEEISLEHISAKVDVLLSNTEWYPKNVENRLQKLKNQVNSISFVGELDFVGFAIVAITKWNKSLHEDQRNFTSIPLHLKMFAEIIFSDLEILHSNYNLFDFFQTFANLKLEIYHKNIFTNFVGADSEVRSSIVNIRKLHQALAAKQYLSLYKDFNLPGLETIESEIVTLKNQMSSGRFDTYSQQELENRQHFNFRMSRIGLLKVNSPGMFTFWHESFGEFFLCIWLIENIKHDIVHEILFGSILFDSEFSLTRIFFENYLHVYYYTNKSLRQIQLKKSLMQLKIGNFWHDSILHAAIRNDNVHTIYFILESCRNVGDNSCIFFLLNDDCMGPIALEYAALVKQHKSFGLLIDYYSYTSVLSLSIEIIKTYTLDTLDKNSTKILILIIQYFKRNNINDISKVLLTQLECLEEDRYTILHILVLCKNIDGIKLYLKEIVSYKNVLRKVIFSTTESGRTPLSIAVAKRYFEEALAILDGIGNHLDLIETLFLKQDISGNTILMLIQDDVTVFENLIGYLDKDRSKFAQVLKELILTPNNFGSTIFEYRNTCLKILKYFISDFDLLIDFALITLYQIDLPDENRRKYCLNDVKDMYLKISVDNKILQGLKNIEDFIEKLPQETERFLSICKKREMNKLSDLTTHWSATFFKQILLDKRIIRHIFFNPEIDLCVLKCVLEKIQHFPLFKSLTIQNNYENGTILHFAVNNNLTEFFDIFLTILEKQTFFMYLMLKPDNQQRTILHLIAELGTQTFIYLLFKRLNTETLEDLQASILHINNRSYTPLELSVVYNNIKVFKPMYNFMVINFVDKEYIRNITEDILYEAVEYGSVDIFKELLTEFSDNKESFWNNFSILSKLLFHIAMQKNTEITTLFITEFKKATEKNPSINRCFLDKHENNDNNQTILHLLCHTDSCTKTFKILFDYLKTQKEVFKELLLSKDDVNQTPFHLAVFEMNEEVVSFFLDSLKNYMSIGKQLLLESDQDECIPMLSSCSKANLAIFTYILEFSILVSNEVFPDIIEKQILHQDRKGYTILHTLLQNMSSTDDDCSKILCKLLKHVSANAHVCKNLIQLADYSGRTILYPNQYEEAHIVALKMLLDGMDKNTIKLLLLSEDNHGITALHVAYWETKRQNEDDEKNTEYFTFLFSIYEEYGLDADNIINKLEIANIERIKLINAMEKPDYCEITTIIGNCTDFLKELLFENDDKRSSIIAQFLQRNNPELIEIFLEQVQDKELLALAFTKYVFNESEIRRCPFGIFDQVLSYIKNLNNKQILCKCLLKDLSFSCIQILHTDGAKIFKLIKETLNEIANLILQSATSKELKLTNFQIKYLKHYVDGYVYTGQNKDKILLRLKEML